MNSIFFHLLRVAISTAPFFERSLTSDEWRALYRVSVEQGVTAVVFDFVKTLSKSEVSDKTLLLEWLSAATGVELAMRRMQIKTEEFAEEMEKRDSCGSAERHGFCAVLPQSVAQGMW